MKNFKYPSLDILDLCFRYQKIQINSYIYVCLPAYHHSPQKCFYVCAEKRSKINGCILCLGPAHISTRRKFDLPSRNAWKLKNCSFFSLWPIKWLIRFSLFRFVLLYLLAAENWDFFSCWRPKSFHRMYINILIFFCLLVRYLSISLLIFILFYIFFSDCFRKAIQIEIFLSGLIVFWLEN